MKSLVYMMTSRCNAHCEFCFEERKHLQNTSITKEVVDKSLAYFFRVFAGEVIAIDFFGGEPTLEEDLCIYIIEQATQLAPKHNIKVRFSLITNLIKYPEKLVNYVLSHPGVNLYSQISNEGFDNTSKDRGDLVLREKIYDNLRRFTATGIPCTVRATLSPHNVTTAQNMLATVKKMVELGLPGYYIFPVMDDAWTQKHYDVFKEGMRLIGDYFIEELVKDNNFVFDCSNFYHDVNSDYPVTCSAGSSYVVIDSNGDVYPCQRLLPLTIENAKPVGNVWDENCSFEPLAFDEVNRQCKTCRVKNCKICPVVSYKKDGVELTIPKTKYCEIRYIMWDAYIEYTKKLESLGMYRTYTKDSSEYQVFLDIEALISAISGYFGLVIYHQVFMQIYLPNYSFKWNVIYKGDTLMKMMTDATGCDFPLGLNGNFENDANEIFTSIEKLIYTIFLVQAPDTKNENEFISTDWGTSILRSVQLMNMLFVLRESQGIITAKRPEVTC